MRINNKTNITTKTGKIQNIAGRLPEIAAVDTLDTYWH